MGFLRPKTKSPAQTPPSKLANMHITEAVIGITLPILMGQRRLTIKVVDYRDFTAIPHVQATAAGGGGKGLGGGGGSSQPQTTYTYTAAVLGALCSGVVNGLVNVWDTKGHFQQTGVTESFTVPVGGGNYVVNNHALYKVDRGVGFQQAFSRGVNDFGSPAPNTLSGTYNVPMVPGTVAAPGVYAVNPATGTYTFHAADAGKQVQISYSFNLLQVSNLEDASIPGSPFQILIDDSADFLQDQGVIFTATNTALQKVGSSPAAGQYTVSGGGLYTFNAADVAKAVAISYVTNTTNQQSDAATSLNLTLLNGSKGQAPWSYLTSRHPEAAIGYSEVALLASQAMDLGTNGELPNYSYEIAGPYQYGSGIVDCDPADCITALLLDPFFGISFPAANIGDLTLASNFWVANSFFISPLIDQQTSVASVIGPILEAGMVACFWSEGQLKFVPYGDTSAAGNGQIYVAPTQPVADLNAASTVLLGDFLTEPSITRSAWQDANNKVQVQWINRSNAYNTEVTTEQDDAAIQRYGLRIESPQSWDFITTLAAAQLAGNLRVKRSVNIRAQYTFSLPSTYTYVEPMDLLTLTVPELGLVKTPVRVTKVVDNPDEKGMEITAEEFPWGTAQPTLYQRQVGIGFQPSAGQADPGNTTALIFEANNRLGMQAGNILYGFVSGQSPDWGGCDVYVSFDGVKYDLLNGQQITTPARIGTLVNSLGVGSVDPDPSSFKVKMSNAGAVLPPMSASDFNQLISMCVLMDTSDNNPFELLAYENATLVDKDTYQLDTLHRGQMGTTNASHTAGETFCRLDQASFQYQYDPTFYGKTIFFKFPSFNTVGGRPQPLSQAAVYQFTLPGDGPGAIDINTGIYRPGVGSVPPSWSGTITWSSAVPGTSLVITWSGNLNRGTMPRPSQSNNLLDLTPYSGTLTITGLTASTNYWAYPFVDDSLPGAPFSFVNNSQVSGAVGSPAIAYTALTPNATYFSGRNDHVPMNSGPLAMTTAPSSGSGTGGSGDPVGGPCPRGDMVCRHREKGVIRHDEVVVGDYVRDRGRWVKVLQVIHGWSNSWSIVHTECGEEIWVTETHSWPLPCVVWTRPPCKAHAATGVNAACIDCLHQHEVARPAWKETRCTELKIGESLFADDDSFTSIVGKSYSTQPGMVVGLVVEGDHTYLIGSVRPRIRTCNGNTLPRS
jgi:hypothetical protein